LVAGKAIEQAAKTIEQAVSEVINFIAKQFYFLKFFCSPKSYLTKKLGLKPRPSRTDLIP
jgi:hypothetical protein